MDRRRRSSRRPSSASSAAASSAGCSASPPGRWAIASRSSTRIRIVRPRPSRIAWSSARTTTSARRSGWPNCSAVVTYELEHVAAAVVAAVEAVVPVRPGTQPLLVTQDRLTERRFVEGAGIAVAPWREVRRWPRRAPPPTSSACRSGSSCRSAATTAAASSGSRTPTSSTTRGRGSAARPATPLLAERELDFARGAVGRRRARARRRPRRPSRSPGTGTTTGILVESVAPAPIDQGTADWAATIGTDLAAAMDLCGTLTAELFLLPRRLPGRQRAGAAGPQLRPLDARRRRDLAVRAAHPGDLRAGSGVDGRAGTGGHGQPPGTRAAAAGAAARAPRPRSPTRPSTSTCTTSARSSNAARWAT